MTAEKQGAKAMKNTVYFDNAATTFPKPQSVIEHVTKVMTEYCANPGRSSHSLAMRAAEEVYLTREKLADLFDCEPENVIFTSSATHSLNLAFKSTLKNGDHVLISDIEHNAVLRPITALAEKGIITYDIYTATSDAERLITEISEKIRQNTAMICACHHSNITNTVIPIGAIGRFCRRKGILFTVDASQSAGTFPISVRRDCIDVLCAPAHKGLYGIPGCGIAIFGDALSDCKRLSTFIEGGNGIASKSPYMPFFLPDRLESGTLPLPAIAALSSGVDFINKRTPEAILKKEKALSAIMRKGLKKLDGVRVHTDSDGAIVLFSVEGLPSETVAELLASNGFCVRAGLHCAPLAHKKLSTPENGAVRVSFGAFNTESEVKSFLYTLDHSVLPRRQKSN